MKDGINVQNILDAIPQIMPEESVAVIAAAGKVRIERIVSRGHTTAPGFWYDQDWPEWVMVVQGRGRLVFADHSHPVDMGPGDHLLIDAHVRHRVVFTDPNQDTIWLAVHFEG